MAAPLGFKTFNTGDVLSAADTNGYLMQGVLVFADAAARSAAITSPQEGQTSYLKDTDVIQVYSGAAWVTKSGGSSPLTTKGDLYTFGTGDTRLAVGANGTTLVADSSEATGLKWQAPAGGSGLTLIAEQTYTAATTINVNNVFSTTYDNYKIINRATCSGGGSFTMKMRVGGTDTSANYFNQLVYGSGGSAIGQANALGTDEWFFGDAEDSGMTSMDIMSPFLAAETEAVALAGYRTTGLSGLVRMIAMALDNATSYTGFSLLIGSNATGKVSIYGYAK